MITGAEIPKLASWTLVHTTRQAKAKRHLPREGGADPGAPEPFQPIGIGRLRPLYHDFAFADPGVVVAAGFAVAVR